MAKNKVAPFLRTRCIYSECRRQRNITHRTPSVIISTL